MDLKAQLTQQLVTAGYTTAASWDLAHLPDTTSRQTPFAVFDPASGTEIGKVPDMTATDASAAIATAYDGFATWQTTHQDERARILRRWAARLRQHRDVLAALITWEQGKPLKEARGEIHHSAALLEWFAGEAERITGRAFPRQAGLRPRATTIHLKAKGVIAAITPWNFPVASVIAKVGAALAAGCTVVHKPAEATPLIALALARHAYAAGVANNAWQIITTSQPATVGAVLCTDPRIAMVTFTGSTQTGGIIAGQAGAHIKPVALELGGNAPFVVFKDADLAVAVAAAVAAKFYNCGQICIGANRFLVHDSLHDAFVKQLTEAMAGLKVGCGFAPDTALGPLITSHAQQKLAQMVATACKQGAELRVAGGPLTATAGSYFAPALLTGVTPEQAVWHQELFGPVACVTRFTTTAEGLALAHATASGLAGYAFTNDLSLSSHLAQTWPSGMLGINTSDICSPAWPFGGTKQSGFGREGGHDALKEFMAETTVVTAYPKEPLL